MEEHSAVRALAALAQPQRLRIFRALIGAGPDGMTPGALCELLDSPPSTLSFHLKELANANLVAIERDGRHLIYRPGITHMNALLEYLTAHCCNDSTCAPLASARGSALDC